MSIKIIKDKVTKSELEEVAKEKFGDFVKAVVDIEKEIAAFGGGMHADEEAELLKYGSRQVDLWGINFYPKKPRGERLEFDSMINIRPAEGNRSRGVEDKEIRERIQKIIDKIITEQ